VNRKQQKLTAEFAKALLEEIRQDAPFPGVAPPPPITRFDTVKCYYCQGVHTRRCPAVSSIEFYENGNPRSVQYFPHGQWPADSVIWLEDVHEAANQAVKGE